MGIISKTDWLVNNIITTHQSYQFKVRSNFYTIYQPMHSVLNHGLPTNNPPTPLDNFSRPANHQFFTKPQSRSANLQPYSEQQSKVSMKQLYKNQLDQFLEEKEKQRKTEKEVMEREKEEYRERVRIGQENEKLKDLAYKNYYKMLMQSHEHNSQSYVSPYQMRDKLKDSHIQHAIQQQMQKSQNYEYEKRMRELQKKNLYKEELTRQIQQRKVFESAKKNYLSEQNNYYRQHTKSPHEITQLQKQRKKEEKQMYRNDLDRIVQDKLVISRKHQPQLSDPKLKASSDFHNPLVNPLPYNIQNPYILKEMQKMSTHNVRNDPTLASQEGTERPRNESSYFARQANNIFM